ncbi:MAG: hypothetical protein ABL867_06450, partial [Rickettsiales bacterium]
MPFKIHLLVISGIIIMVFIISKVLIANKIETEQSALTTIVKKSPYSITIENASWGMNCQNFPQPERDDSQGGNTISIKENNVIYPISRLCNGNPRCDIAVDSNFLGEPMVSCPKTLEVEYRCFNIDRLRKSKATDGILS